MTQFETIVPKEIENVFLEFELKFGMIVAWAEDNCIVWKQEQIEGVKHFVPVSTKTPTIRIIKKNKCLDEYFQKLIADLISHLTEQLGKYGAGKLGTFFLKNRGFYTLYSPVNRKKELDQAFVNSIHSGYYYVHNVEVNLDSDDKEFAKYTYTNYCTYYEKLKSEIGKIESIYLSTSQKETDNIHTKLKAPLLGLFCSLINKIGIDKKEETESAAVYCERICIKYKLPYTDRVRQNYNVKETKKLIQELAEKILPLIDNETKILVQKYLDSKNPPKQNLYG